MMLRTHILNNSGVEPELRRIIHFMAECSKYIHNAILEGDSSYAGSANSSGEEQLALDKRADKILREQLAHDESLDICDFLSEEQDTIVPINTGKGRYSVAVDPLDGSSLIDVNLAVGTIVGIHKGHILGEEGRSGLSGKASLVSAMYVLYGPITTLVYSTGHGVHEFRQDRAGNFVLRNENIRMFPEGKIYSPGGLDHKWLMGHARYIHELRQTHKLRYSGGFVPDINQILLKGGGSFSYPELEGHPNGKLRLLFELQPMAYLIENAGGAASDGYEPILNLVPEEVDQRSPVYIGSMKEVALAEQHIAWQKDHTNGLEDI